MSDDDPQPVSGSHASERQYVERSALVICALLAIGMGTFLLVDWLRHIVDPATVLFDQYLLVGTWIDWLFGTNVFWVPATWRALATGVFIGIAAPLLGAFLIHRQMALIGETLAHTAFAGVAAGVVLVGLTGWTGSLLVLELGSQGSLLAVALVVSAVGALGLQWLTKRSDAYGDVPIAIVLSGSFAAGTVLITWGRGFAPISIDVEGFLFGSLAIVTAAGARLVALLTIAIVALVVYAYKEFFYITFDEQAANVARIPVDRYNTLMVVMTAVVVVGAMQILGVILVAAMLVVPAATASQLARSFRETVALSVIMGQLAVVAGLGISIIWGHPPGGTIVLVAIGWYLLATWMSGGSAGRLSYA